jgi:hypothetical protein
MKRLALVLLAACCGTALADEPVWLELSTFSHHVQRDSLNQRNPGLGAEVGQYHFGEYLNSVRRPSWYVGREFHVGDGPVRAGVLVGAITGYPIAEVAPLIAPFVRFDHGPVGANIVLIPDPVIVRHSALGLQIRLRVG